MLLGCNTPASDAEQPVVATVVSSNCAPGSFLKASLYGVIETDIDWSGSELNCENMPRPNAEGVRLRFSGAINEHRLSFIVAMPELRRDQQHVESPSNVTVTVEGSGRFFSTPDLQSCWTDVSEHQVAGDSHHISAQLYCIAPLGEVNGDGAVTITDLVFRSSIDWEKH